ncbi:GrxA family glutaredoxin [Pseudomaricurvus alkylphenolicus]|uniref:GrxA family glutaredoxin n=1 Tax=Pseudomaricurvus alkylphenolicus TaxID=1306991 RepID=UPI00142173C3|nr:GrxA family glutaredoxin [Pseudomaricurvus alkylphenolicus]NIB39671.1 GrxA family glutaredoxin [Pseudomaricurvus alkylphenolicus]
MSHANVTRYTLFGHQQCGFCRRAKQLLEEQNLPFRYVDIHQEGISKADLSKTVGHEVTTVPQIFHGQEYVGGFEALQRRLTEAA